MHFIDLLFKLDLCLNAIQKVFILLPMKFDTVPERINDHQIYAKPNFANNFEVLKRIVKIHTL